MFAIIEGVPGSGKSYYAVKQLWENFIIDKFDYIVTNIDGLKVELMYKLAKELYNKDIQTQVLTFTDLEFIFKDFNNVEIIVKTPENNYKLTNKHLIAFFIDEAHIWFSEFDVNFFNYLTYHRHYGHTIYFITQDYSNINLKYVRICEVRYKIKKTKILGLRKNKMLLYMGADRKHFAIKDLSFDDFYFKLYKSFDNKEVNSVKDTSLLRNIIIASLFAVILFPISLYYFFHNSKEIVKLPNKQSIEKIAKNNKYSKHKLFNNHSSINTKYALSIPQINGYMIDNNGNGYIIINHKIFKIKNYFIPTINKKVEVADGTVRLEKCNINVVNKFPVRNSI
jgi:zona occludens toxin (predicted ATPase)